MITNNEIKRRLDEALENLKEASGNLFQAIRESGNSGLRSDLSDIGDGIRIARAEIEDILYPAVDEITLEHVITSVDEMFRFTTDEKSVVFTEANH